MVVADVDVVVVVVVDVVVGGGGVGGGGGIVVAASGQRRVFAQHQHRAPRHQAGQRFPEEDS